MAKVQTDALIQKKKTPGFIVRRVLLYVVLIVIGLTMLVPFLWMISTSLKEQYDAVKIPPVWIPPVPRWQNYVDIFTEQPMFQFMLNTIKIVFFVVLGQLFFSSLAAYSFARIRFKGRTVMFFFYIATLMVPGQVTMIPTYLMFAKVGLVDNHIALILPAFFSAFGVFLLRQFFMSLPKELEEAAWIDGAGPFKTYLSIVMPLSGVAVLTVVIFSIVWHWNDYYLSAMYMSENFPLAVSLSQIRSGLQMTTGYGTDANPVVVRNILMAGCLMFIAPILLLYLVLQKWFIRGIETVGIVV